MLEDDCTFGPNFTTVADVAIADNTWGMCYLGHVEIVETREALLIEWAPSSSVPLAHCYAVRAPVLPLLCRYLEAMILRQPGSPDGGPMSPDGALGWFRRSHPEIRTLLASPSVAGQRSSRSDLSPHPIDRIPFIRDAAAVLRGWRRQIG